MKTKKVPRSATNIMNTNGQNGKPNHENSKNEVVITRIIEQTLDYHERNETKKNLEGSLVKLDWSLEFREKIGEGGLGEVWKGFLVGDYDVREVAIKVSKRERSSLVSLRREAHIAGQLKHEDIGKIILYEENEDNGMIIMDYIEGKDLGKILNWHKKLGLRFPKKFAAYITWSCCEALKYAHNNRVYDEDGKEVIGVLHRDISPGNIIINKQGYPKVIDFGIGILPSDLENPEIMKQIAGKIGFIAPEILEQNLLMGEKIDRRVDIYGLGMVMDYLVRGNNPLVEAIKKNNNKNLTYSGFEGILDNIAKTLTEEVDGIDEVYSKIVEKSTKRDRKERYHSAFEMKEDLRKYLFERGYGPDKDRLSIYLDLINTPGLSRHLKSIGNRETNIKIPTELRNKFDLAKEMMPYMVREGKFCLEILKESDYKTEEPGYLPVY